MTDRYPRRTEFPDVDAPAIRHCLNDRIADARHERVPPVPGDGRATPPAKTDLWPEAI
ncbi:hypothetical protein [Sagittula stellata]|uniref:Uncharacterized protein n=1 Tax=Sagittula stellata (strain ATCC 700073 / DSM 11524 / E-37) TaxID=388399 RepID=A3JZY8_SAGS3|nr:hypothetical protein [Sagittula stellata]EBA09103.1 hypothetical protein SSE37_22714 [Sagittula stellata E-37]